MLSDADLDRIEAQFNYQGVAPVDRHNGLALVAEVRRLRFDERLRKHSQLLAMDLERRAAYVKAGLEDPGKSVRLRSSADAHGEDHA